jgi:hypothetical protein
MRSRLFLSLIAGAALVVAGSAAQAGPLLSATWTSTTQGIFLSLTNAAGTCSDTLTVHVQDTRTISGVNCDPGPVAGGLGGPTGTATATSYSVSLTVPLFEIKQFTTGGAINIYTHATLAGGAAISGTDSAAAATMGVLGQVTVNVAAHQGLKSPTPSALKKAPTTLVKVPLSVGVAGTTTGYFYVLQNLHYITVDFYAWTPHTLTFTGLTSKYAPLPTPTVVAMGDVVTMGGVITQVILVSPSMISIDGPLAQRRTASFTTLTLTYAPEPGALLLLGAGVAGLVLLGSRKPS